MGERALIFANGDIVDGPMVRRAVESQDGLVIAADGGARVAQHFELKIDILIGDLDSLSDDEVQALADADVRIERHSPEKDFTDLELALIYASEQGFEHIDVIGGTGGRLDQTLGNIYLLALPQLHGCKVSILAGKQEIRLLQAGQHDILGQKDDTISLIPIGGPAEGVTTHNLYYPLDRETLEFGPARGISNVMVGEKAVVTLDSGVLLLVHTIGRA